MSAQWRCTDLLVLIKSGLQLVHVPESQHGDEGRLISAQSLDPRLVQLGGILTGQVEVHHSCRALGPDLLQLLRCQLMTVALSRHQHNNIRFVWKKIRSKHTKGLQAWELEKVLEEY